VLPNLVFLGMYFMITSYGGDGWGGGFFGECPFPLFHLLMRPKINYIANVV
jgi:hypothetical protein